MLREVAGAGIVGEDGYTMRVGYVATHPTNNVETPTEQPLLRRAKPVGAVRACLQFGGSAPFPLGLGQLAQRERGWGGGSKQLKHWKLEFRLINNCLPPPQPSLAAGFALRGRGYFGGIFFRWVGHKCPTCATQDLRRGFFFALLPGAISCTLSTSPLASKRVILTIFPCSS